MSRRTLTVVIPAYNEQQALGDTLRELHELIEKQNLEAEIIVVDDGSADQTSAVALDSGARVLRHRNNRGYGASLKTGILAASNDIVAIADGDGTYPFEYLPGMLEELENVDMVIGARTGANVNIPLVRKPAKWMLGKLANYVSGAKILDLNSGLRVFRRELVLQYFPILPDQFSWTTTITLALLCDSYTIRYVPIDYRLRLGKSKIVPWDAGTFTILILRMAVLFRPLRVFLPLVFICTGYGVLKMIVDLVFVADRNISASAIMMFMSALIILLVGMVADAVATRLGRLPAYRLESVHRGESIEISNETTTSREAQRSEVQ